ncbi:hypothetical protein POTOM_043626 [Populus tomentosa]|uniref:glutamate--tRNA ligase n=2 Tax=Populus TaxID=3689 RepID=A0A8X7YER2_POPTO|nr:hypothetical protein POTOM_043626 [Populus tomentosa]
MPESAMASIPKTQTPKANTTPSTTKHPTNQHQNTQNTASPTSTRPTPPSGFWADKIRVTDSNTRCTLDPIPRKPGNSDASPSHQVKGNASHASNTDGKQLNGDASTSHQGKGKAITSLATNTDEMSSEESDSSGETDTNCSDETDSDESASDSLDESQLKPSDLGDVNPITPPLSTNNHVRTTPLELPMCTTSKQMALPSSSETSSSSQVPPTYLPKMTASRARPPESSAAHSVGCDDTGFTLVTRRKKKKDTTHRVAPSFLPSSLYHLRTNWCECGVLWLKIKRAAAQSAYNAYLDLEMVEFTLREVLVAATSQVMMKSNEKGIRIINDAAEEMMAETLYGDSIRLQQVLADFLLMSVNFTPSGGLLTVSASFSKDQLGQSVYLVHLELRIRHPGAGIPEALLDQMYGEDTDASVEGISLVISRKLVKLMNGDVRLKVQGTYVLLRYIGRVAILYGQDPFQSSQIDQWLDYAPVLSVGSEFENACNFIDNYLQSRTFLVEHSLSIADIAIWSGLAGNGLRWESWRKSKKFPNLVRWFNSIFDEYSDALNEVISTYVGKKGSGKPAAAKPKGQQVVSRDNPEKGKASGRLSSSEIDLPDAEIGKVCLRFAPEPSGYLHIGHSKAALLNQYFAQRYKGQMIIRFDDTNPSKESNEFVHNLLKDIEALGIKYETVTHTSDYFPRLMEMAESLIRQGKAYVDDTPREQMQKERMDGIESKCRSNSVEENLKLWKEMIKGSERGLQCCVRGKLDMQDPNKSLRDPVYYRCNPVPHHRIGSKYKIYPTYDFACPFVDSVEGITHALRSSEYHDRNAQYDRIQADMGLRKVHIYEFSRLNMVYTILSKRHLRWFVENGRVDGWDDARFPTVQGIARRGLKIEALGASKNLNLMEWDKLWTINKKIIDPVCPRHTAVIEEQRVPLTLTNGPEQPFVRIIQRHKKYEGAGEKATTYTNRIWIDHADAESISVNEEITLMNWGNAIVKEIEKDQDGKVTHLSGVLHLEGSVKTTKLKLTWLPDTSELVNLTLVDFDYLITKKKLEEGESFLDVLNPSTKKETAALGDSNMRNLKRGEILQLERKGYFRCDAPFVRPSKPVVLFAIPDGRQATSLSNFESLDPVPVVECGGCDYAFPL